MKAKYYIAKFKNYENSALIEEWGLSDIDGKSYHNGDGIEAFMEFVESLGTVTVYMHGLKTDGVAIMDYLLREKYIYTSSISGGLLPGFFSTLITEDGDVFSITEAHPRGTTMFKDSTKLTSADETELRKAFRLDIKSEGLEKDVRTVASVLKILQAQGLKKSTAASCAMSDYKKRCGGSKAFRELFPEIGLDCDNDLRKTYRGGWCFVNPIHAGKPTKPGTIVDCNGLYSYIQRDFPLPYGVPEYFTGRGEACHERPLFIQHLRASFILKPGALPWIQIKYDYRYDPNSYIYMSSGLTDLYLTSPELELLAETYDVSEVEYIDGWSFKASADMFKGYVDYWQGVKTESTKQGNGALRQVAKIMLNALGGRFGLKMTRATKRPVLTKQGLRYKLNEADTNPGVYLPVIIFITAYGRVHTVRKAISCGSRFLYSDTDSVAFVGKDVPECFKVDKYELGAWKVCADFSSAIFCHAKCYIYEDADGVNVKISGMPDYMHEQVTFENFRPGAVYEHKLVPEKVPGGVIFRETTFKISDSFI